MMNLNREYQLGKFYMKTTFVSSIAAVFCVAGCAMPASDDSTLMTAAEIEALDEGAVASEATDADESEAVGESADALGASGPEYTWEQGQPSVPKASVPMGSASGRVCFLTRVAGHFQGGGEGVRAYVSGGSWYLGGNSQQSGVSARARCVSVPSYSDEYSWSQYTYVAYMGSASNRSCFLTGVKGHFEGGGEFVQAYISGDSWYLGGQSQQQSVGASARCVDIAPSPEYSWGQGQDPTYMGLAADRSCFLTYMRGKFEGSVEAVQTYEVSGWWYLGGSSEQRNVSAKARCL